MNQQASYKADPKLYLRDLSHYLILLTHCKPLNIECIIIAPTSNSATLQKVLPPEEKRPCSAINWHGLQSSGRIGAQGIKLNRNYRGPRHMLCISGGVGVRAGSTVSASRRAFPRTDSNKWPKSKPYARVYVPGISHLKHRFLTGLARSCLNATDKPKHICSGFVWPFRIDISWRLATALGQMFAQVEQTQMMGLSTG